MTELWGLIPIGLTVIKHSVVLYIAHVDVSCMRTSVGLHTFLSLINCMDFYYRYFTEVQVLSALLAVPVCIWTPIQENQISSYCFCFVFSIFDIRLEIWINTDVHTYIRVWKLPGQQAAILIVSFFFFNLLA